MLIFISSTYRDLVSERKAIEVALHSGEPAAWGMEYFNSQPERPLDVCLKEVAQCDAVVLVIGFRGGSLIPTGPTLTYTGAEIQEAERLGRPVFAFIKTEGCSWRNDEPPGSVRVALDEFKQHVLAACGTVSHFESLSELQFRVLASLKKWTEQGRPGARKTFALREEYFAPYNNAAGVPRLFDFLQVLRGRRKELGVLDAFLADPDKAVGVLDGRGGIGKTKLLYEWTSGIHDYAVSFLKPSATWHRESDKELPSGDLLLAADDAHRASHLPELLALARELSQTGRRRVKVLLSTRPSGREALRSTLARFFEPAQISEMPPLEKLGVDDVRALATEVLGPEPAHLRDWLVTVSGDTPLVTVVAGRLIARGKLRDLALNNKDEFCRAVFDRFIDEYSAALPGTNFPRRKLINLLAALSPARTSDPEFLKRAEDFIGQPTYEIHQALDELERHGLLITRDGRLGIAPDTLADFLLESACVNTYGQSTGYADAVYQSFRDVDLATLLTNLAELEWRLEQKGSPGGVLATIWESVNLEFRDGDAVLRCKILDALEAAAVFQPDQTMAIVRLAMDTEARVGRAYGYRTKAQTDVLQRLPKLLGALAYNQSHLRRAVRRLFTLANRSPEHSAGQKRADQILERLATYQRYKPVSFLSDLADVAKSLAAEPLAFEGTFTPLDIADEMLKREIQHEESNERTLRIGSLGLNYPVVEPVRKKALEVIRASVFSTNPREAGAAVKSLSSVLSAFSPSFGRALTDNERGWQDAERLAALDILVERLRAPDTPLPLIQMIKSMLRRHNPEHHSEPFNSRLQEVQTAIADTKELAAFDAFCTAEHAMVRGGKDLQEQMRRAREEIEVAVSRFTKAQPSMQEKLRTLEGMAQAADAYRIQTNESAYTFIEILCRDTEFSRAFIDYVLGDPHPRLAFQIRALVPKIRDVDPAEYERVGTACVKHQKFEVAWGAAHGVSIGPALNSPIAEDLRVLRVLALHSHPDVRRLAVHGAAHVGRCPEFVRAAIGIIAQVDVAGQQQLGDEVRDAFGPQGIPTTDLTRDQVESILNQLVSVAHVHDSAYGFLFSKIGEMTPDLLQRFFLKRLKRLAEVRYGEAFGYSHWGGQPLRRYFDRAVPPLGIADQLREIRNLLDHNDIPSPWIAELFWVFGDAGCVASAVISEWLHSDDPSRVRKAEGLARMSHRPEEEPLDADFGLLSDP
jgi:Domain of unknown function (DUF4062)